MKSIEPYNEDNSKEFQDCTNCVRYYDTVICKCKQQAAEQVAFLYPTDITPDTNLDNIKLKGSQNA